MREIFLKSDDIYYECPYCHIEIGDFTGDEIETRTEYCSNCSNEFLITVIK